MRVLSGQIALVLSAIVFLSACTDRSVTEIAPRALEIGTPETIFAVSSRAREPDGSYGYRRSEKLRYLEMTVSIPPTHKPGHLNFSYANPDPKTQFTLARQDELPSVQALEQQLRDAQGGVIREVTVFVHGYNATQTETAFRAAQLAHDIGIPGSVLIYSWPSRARAFGYAYDIDSMLFARDGLEQTIRQLKAMGVERISLVAHSMGSALSMEMIRQVELEQPGWSARNLEGVILISPDLDIDVFRTQMDRIKSVPDPFVVMVSEKDKALNISARLRGTTESKRLGNLDTIDRISEYPIYVINTTAFAGDAQSSHFVAATSPALLAMLNAARRMSDTFGPEETAIDLLIPGESRAQAGATETVLTGTGELRGETR